jgi:tetratricopeptide (TPR) repeat protein
MREKIGLFILGAAITAALFFGIYQVPIVKYQLEWRLDAAVGIIRGWMYPGDTLPTPVGASKEIKPPTAMPTHTPGVTPDMPTPTPQPTPTPLPDRVSLEAPEWEKQDWNNCGPATLALALRYYGWNGDQFDISDRLKPDRGDKNVNIDELIYFVRNYAGWLNSDYRVGGSLQTLKAFLAEGYPVIVEKGYVIESDGPDAGWAGHYMLLTGYDDGERIFIGQDSFIGPDRHVSYAELDKGWRQFNRAYMFLYPVADPPPIADILGESVDRDVNRERALETAREEIEANPEDPYAWFNLGTNLVYFERYREASEAYDQALSIGLPWRFTRYQFGPYIAYFHSGRTEDLIDLANATLQRTAKAEESLLWRGWAEYRLGDVNSAVADFRAALRVNPNYEDALYALEFLGFGF